MAALANLFVDVARLPKDSYGFIQLLYLGGTYAMVLMHSSNMIKDGSELLLLIPKYAGIVGSIVLPVLGAVPDGAIVLFSGLGPNAQEEVTVGVGALAGSTIMLLTVPWFLSILAGRVTINPDGNCNYVKPKGAGSDWKKLKDGTAFGDSGVSVGESIKYTAKVMVFTLLPFFIIQIPAIMGHCIELDEEKKCKTPGNAALAGGAVAVAQFLWYLWDQARLANADVVKQDKIDQLRSKAVNDHLLSLRGLFPDKVMDSEGSVPIHKDDKRFRAFLLPFFRRFDSDGSGEIDKHEFAALVHSLGEKPDATRLDELMKHMDKDGSGTVDFSEFCESMVELLKDGNFAVSTAAAGAVKTIDAEEDDDEEEEEEDEMPEDLADLSPEEQQSRLLKRSFYLMGLGVLITLLFSDPAVDVLSELGARTGIKAFFIAFCLAPCASNGSEVIAAYAYASKKTEKTMTISFSSLLGAACMNNTFCLAIFLFLVYLRNLKWTFAAETATIILVEVIMFFFASRRVSSGTTGVMVVMLFPLAMALVAGLEKMGYD